MHREQCVCRKNGLSRSSFIAAHLKEVEEFGPDYVVGSSMGGWFGLNMAIHLNVPCMFNPAVVKRFQRSRSHQWARRAQKWICCSATDDVVNGHDVVDWMNLRKFPINVTWADCGHRVPPEVYGPWLDEAFALH